LRYIEIYKVRGYLWISYFFDDIITFLGLEKLLIRWIYGFITTAITGGQEMGVL
jgi:hypothetical protein